MLGVGAVLYSITYFDPEELCKVTWQLFSCLNDLLFQFSAHLPSMSSDLVLACSGRESRIRQRTLRGMGGREEGGREGGREGGVLSRCVRLSWSASVSRTQEPLKVSLTI